MEELTQAMVDFSVCMVKATWYAKLKESGLDQSTFIVVNKDKWVTNFLAAYETVKEDVEIEGLVMPDLLEGVTVELGDVPTDK